MRLIAMPLAGLALDALLVGTGAVAADARMLRFVLLLESAAPTAQGNVVMAQMVGYSPRAVTAVVLGTYLPGVLSNALFISLFLVWIAP